MNKFLSVAVLAALGLTLIASDASAFGGRRRKAKNCCATAAPVATSSCGGCGVAYGTVGQPAYATAAPAVAMPMATTTTPTPMPAVAGQPAVITVLVPNAEAQVWFEDTQLPQTGKERTFKTPVVADGKSHSFNVKAKWTNDSGKAVEKTLPVSVKAGQTSTVDFR